MLSQSWLTLALSDIGKASSIFSQKPALHTPPRKPNTWGQTHTGSMNAEQEKNV